MEDKYILYEVITWHPYEGCTYPARYVTLESALLGFDSQCKDASEGYDRVQLLGIDKDGDEVMIKEY